jgi:hypothetical protein
MLKDYHVQLICASHIYGTLDKTESESEELMELGKVKNKTTKIAEEETADVK